MQHQLTIALPEQIAGELAPLVSSAAPGARIILIDSEGHADGPLDTVEVFLRWFTPAEVFNQLVERMPALRWLHIPRAGADTSLVPAVLARHDLLLTNSAGVYDIPIAEFVLMFMLTHSKRTADLYELQRRRDWNAGRNLQLSELYGKTLLIIGLGQIGRAVATRAAAFGMHVVGSRRSAAPVPGVGHVIGPDEWRRWLGDADYVVIAAPLTRQTRGMFGHQEFASMRRDAYLINIARGPIVDEAALIEALRAERIAGAALDVFDEEPLPPDHPFWSLKNVFATPHISWSSPAVRQRTLDLFIDNVRRYVRGEELLNIVDKEAGY